MDAAGAPLGEGRLGEIVAAGSWVAGGYQGAQTGGPTRFARGRLCTGDAGFLLERELFVLGRMGDSTKVRGRSIYAEDVEARLAAIPGVPAGRVVVVFGRSGLQPVVGVPALAPVACDADEKGGFRMVSAYVLVSVEAGKNQESLRPCGRWRR